MCYNFTKFHQNWMNNKKVLLIARFSVQNFKVSIESWKSYIVYTILTMRDFNHMLWSSVWDWSDAYPLFEHCLYILVLYNMVRCTFFYQMKWPPSLQTNQIDNWHITTYFSYKWEFIPLSHGLSRQKELFRMVVYNLSKS